MELDFWIFGSNIYLSESDILIILVSVGIPLLIWLILTALANWDWKPKNQMQYDKFVKYLDGVKDYQSQADHFLKSHPKKNPYVGLIEKTEIEVKAFGTGIDRLERYISYLEDEINSTDGDWRATLWPVKWLALLKKAGNNYKNLCQPLRPIGEKIKTLMAQTANIAEQVHRQILTVKSDSNKVVALHKKLKNNGLVGDSLFSLEKKNLNIQTYLKALPEESSTEIIQDYKKIPPEAIVIGYKFIEENQSVCQDLLKTSTYWDDLVTSIEKQIKEVDPILLEGRNYYQKATRLSAVDWSLVDQLLKQHISERRSYAGFPNQVDVDVLVRLNENIGNLISRSKRFTPDIQTIESNYMEFRSLLIQIPPKIERLNLSLADIEKQKPLSLDWHVEKTYLSRAFHEYKILDQKQIQTPPEINSDLNILRDIKTRTEQIQANYIQAKSYREYVIDISERIRNNSYPLPKHNSIADLYRDVSAYDLANWKVDEQGFINSMSQKLNNLLEKTERISEFSLDQIVNFTKLFAITSLYQDFTKEQGELVGGLDKIRITLQEVRTKESKCRELLKQYQSDADYAVRLTRNGTFQQIAGSELADFLSEFDNIRREIGSSRYGIVNEKMQRLEAWVGAFESRIGESYEQVKSAVQKQDLQLQGILENIQSLVNFEGDSEAKRVRAHLTNQRQLIAFTPSPSEKVNLTEQLCEHWRTTAESIRSFRQIESDVSRTVGTMKNEQGYAHNSKDEFLTLLNKKWPPCRQDTQKLNSTLENIDSRLKNTLSSNEAWREKLHLMDTISLEYRRVAADYKHAKNNFERDKDEIQNKENKIKRVQDAWKKFRNGNTLDSDARNRINQIVNQIDKKLDIIKSKFSGKGCSESNYTTASYELDELLVDLNTPVIVNNIQYMAFLGNIESGGDVTIRQTMINHQ